MLWRISRGRWWREARLLRRIITARLLGGIARGLGRITSRRRISRGITRLLWRIVSARLRRISRLLRRISRLLWRVSRLLRGVSWLLRREITCLLAWRSSEGHAAPGAKWGARVGRRAAIGTGRRQRGPACVAEALAGSIACSAPGTSNPLLHMISPWLT